MTGRHASDNGQLLVVNKLDQQDFFVNDTWSKGRVTMNLGLRWDRYKGWMPEQSQPAFANGPVSVPAQTFAARDFYTWNNLGPRIGLTYDLADDGKTVLKASYGLFWHNPGPGVSADANPNQNNKSVTYTWTDRNGDRRYQLGEESANPTVDDAGRHHSARSEHHLAVLARRIGVSRAPGHRQHRRARRLRLQDRRRSDRAVQPGTSDLGLHGCRTPSSIPVSMAWQRGPPTTARIGLLGVPNTADVNTRFPLTNVTQNTPRFSRYKTVEASMNKRLANRWAAQIGGSYTWAHDFPAPIRTTRTADSMKTPRVGTSSCPAPTRRRTASASSPLVRHQAGANFARQFVGRRRAAPPRPARSSAAPSTSSR